MLGQGEPTPYYQIQELTVAKEPYEKLWQGAVKFHRYYEKWMNGPLLEVNAEEVEEEVGGCVMMMMNDELVDGLVMPWKYITNLPVDDTHDV